METIIYLMRHADKITGLIDEYNAQDTREQRNQKRILSIKGEGQAKLLSELPSLQNINVIYSSHYVRCMGTAKYLAEKLDLKIKIDSRVGEHLYGENQNIKEQFYINNIHHDFDYRLPGGESFNDMKSRMGEAFDTIVKWNYEKEIAIFSHELPLICLLANFCKAEYNLDDELILNWNDKLSIPSRWTQPDGYKITMNEMTITNIEKIEMPFTE